MFGIVMWMLFFLCMAEFKTSGSLLLHLSEGKLEKGKTPIKNFHLLLSSCIIIIQMFIYE